MVAVKFENVSFAYKRGEAEKIKVLSNINLEINEGEFIALVGHNGSGKSTLAKLVNGLLIPNEGKVSVFEFDTKDEKTIFELRKNVGVVFQNPDNQTVATIVEDDIAFGPENIGIEPQEIRKRVNFALESVGMQAYAERSASKLSGGQKQRIAIAGVLAIMPKIIVFDESTAMLDPKGRKEILDIIRKINAEYGITVILISHYMEETVFADRLFVLENGEITLSGKPIDVFTHCEYLESIGLDVPIATKIRQTLKNYDIEIPNLIDTSSLVDYVASLKRSNND